MNNTLSILTNQKLYWGVIFLFTIVYVRGLFNIIYGIDASIYASISAEMSETGNYLQLFHKGNDYLDKPPLHFWLSSLSFKLFGINTVAYKLPSFLLTVIGAVSTYKLGKILYSKEIGKLSALFFYASFAMILINQDVRTDTILVGIIIFTLWQLIAYVKTNNYLNFVLGFIGIGFAMLAKGPIGLMVPVLALGTHFILKKEWNHLFKWQWILGLIISGMVIFPMAWGLYHQFDLQPTKSFKLASGMDGTGTSGLQFYFWDQSFGRITGSNKEWKNNSSIFFFVHTFLWSFLPWSIIGVLALFKKIKNSFNHLKDHELYTLGAIILPFVAFSISQFQLPHYIYVFFPLWMILSGWYYVQLTHHVIWYKVLRIIHLVLNISLTSVSILVLTYFFPTKSIFIWLPFIGLLLFQAYLYLKTKGKNQLVLTTLTSFLAVMIVFNFHFIPKALEYDGFHYAAVKSTELKVNRIFSNTPGSLAFDIYSNHRVEYIDLMKLKTHTNQHNYVFVDQNGLELLESNYDIIYKEEIPHFSITHLNLNFLKPSTRESTLGSFYLIGI